MDTGCDSDGGGLVAKKRPAAALGAEDGACLKRPALEVAEEDDEDLEEDALLTPPAPAIEAPVRRRIKPLLERLPETPQVGQQGSVPPANMGGA